MPAHPRYLTESQLDQFWSDGYLVLKGTLDAATVETARNAILDLIPRDLSLPEHYIAYCGRIKPMHTDGNHSFYSPALLPLLQNEGLYRAAADILETDYIRVGDGSVGITLRDSGREGRIQNLHLDARPGGPEDLNPSIPAPRDRHRRMLLPVSRRRKRRRHPRYSRRAEQGEGRHVQRTGRTIAQRHLDPRR